VGFCASRTGTWASSKSAERYARETKKPPCSVAEAGRIASKRSVTVGSVLFAVVAKERASAMGCVSDASRVAIERLITAGRVDEAGRIAIERLNTIGRVAIAFGVEKECGVTGRRIIAGERISANGIVVPSSRVSIERVNTNGVVVAATGVAEQGTNTCRRVVPARGVVMERLETKAAVPDSAGQIDQHSAAIGCVAVGQNVQFSGLRPLRKRKAGEQEWDEKQWSCRLKLI
jgi:hypothetical protein